MSSDEFREHQAANVAQVQPYRVSTPKHGGTLVAPSRRLHRRPASSPRARCHHLAQRLEEVDAAIHGGGRRMFYCAVPPSLFPKIATRLGEEGLNQAAASSWRSPSASNLASAMELNRQLHEVFDENQIYRIDHYLGKETVQNILVLAASPTACSSPSGTVAT